MGEFGAALTLTLTLVDYIIVVPSGEPLVERSRGERLAELLSAKRLNSWYNTCLLYTSPSPRDATLSRMPSSA